jgi:hypothetical protein
MVVMWQGVVSGGRSVTWRGIVDGDGACVVHPHPLTRGGATINGW